MDNNSNNSQRPRKRITPEIARKRQLAALCVIAFLVLMIIILIAKGCTKDKSKDSGDKKKSDTKPQTTIVTTTAPSTESTTAPSTQTTSDINQNTSGFKLDRYSVYLNVGESEMPLVKEYPAGLSEADERWSSSDTSIATVNEWGNITAVSAGECYVTLKSAADETQEVQIKVTVASSGTGEEPTTTAAQDQQNQQDQAVY